MRLEERKAVASLGLLSAVLALYLFFWKLSETFFPLPIHFYARLIEVLALALFATLAVFAPMSFSEMGILVPRRTLFRSLLLGGMLSLVFVGILIQARLLRGGVPGQSFFSLALSGDIARCTYFLVAPMQEVLAKSALLYAFELIFGRRHPRVAVVASALSFGAFHVVYGFRMMILAALLSLVTGWLFHRERCVWGCALLHFTCGFFPACFGFA